MTPRFRRSISTRLTMMNMLVSGVALLLACAGFFTYDQITFRENLVRTLSAQAQIIGSNTISAILFNDPQSAMQTLSAFKNSPNVLAAGISTLDGRLFAQYAKPGEAALSVPALPPGQVESSRFGNTRVVLVREILSEGKPIGYVYLRADLHEIDVRLWRYAAIALLVLLLSLLIAMLISSGFRKSVAQPIVQLAATAQTVSREQDYGVRMAPIGQHGELTVLINAFNEMLSQIQQRDDALQHAHDELEQRVSERTNELVSANRELEAFSYSVSHDLRGPLDTLNGFSYVLLKQYGGKLDDQGKELIEHIRSSGRRMADLIDDLLELSRLSTSALHLEKVDLSEIARSIMEDLCRAEPERKVEFIAPVRQEAFADARLLRIVMENLLRNAWKYTSKHEHARIEFGREVKNDRSVFFVKDDGSGFDQRSSDRLFQPFHRLHSTQEFPGSGIGLATVRRIIQRHSGEVWAEGAVERGATFYFTVGSQRSDSSGRPVVTRST